MKKIIIILITITLFGCKKNTDIIDTVIRTEHCQSRLDNFTIPHNQFVDKQKGDNIPEVGLEFIFTLKYNSFDSCRLYYLEITDLGNLQYEIDTVSSELFISDEIIWYFQEPGVHNIIAKSYICDIRFQADVSIFILQSEI